MASKKETIASIDPQIRKGDYASTTAAYRFSTEIEVRFRDVDALGHVNNAVYLTYFEIARMHYWTRVLGKKAFSEYGFVVVRAECNYRSPAHIGEWLKVVARVSELKESSFVFSYEILEGAISRVVADGLTVQVCFDPAKKKARAIPDDLRSHIVKFEKGLQ